MLLSAEDRAKMCFQRMLSFAGYASSFRQDNVCSGIHTLTPRREGSGASKKENVLWSHTVLGSNPNSTSLSPPLGIVSGVHVYREARGVRRKLLDLCGLQCHHL